MEKERRVAPRRAVDLKAKVIIDDRELNCTVRNLSFDGVLLHFPKAAFSELSNQDVGKEILFSVSTRSSQDEMDKSQLVRYFHDQDKHCLALKFI